MTVILNLTQHQATNEQVEAGVVDLPKELQGELKNLLTFEEIPSVKEMRERAKEISNLLKETPWGHYDDEGHPTVSFRVMIGGAPFFMGILATELEMNFMATVVYAFSKRVAVEDPETGVKTSVFKHEGFIPHTL